MISLEKFSWICMHVSWCFHAFLRMIRKGLTPFETSWVMSHCIVTNKEDKKYNVIIIVRYLGIVGLNIPFTNVGLYQNLRVSTTLQTRSLQWKQVFPVPTFSQGKPALITGKTCSHYRDPVDIARNLFLKQVVPCMLFYSVQDCSSRCNSHHK